MKKELKVKGYPFVNHVDQSINPEIEINLVSIYESKHHLFLNNFLVCSLYALNLYWSPDNSVPMSNDCFINSLIVLYKKFGNSKSPLEFT